jgi:hypothetical protein
MQKSVVCIITLDGMRVVGGRVVQVPRNWTASKIMRKFSTKTDHVAVTSGPARVIRNMPYTLPDEIIY